MSNHTRLKSLAAMFALVMSVSACDATSGRETPGAYLDDSTVTARVIAEIVKDPVLKKSQISVETFENNVQLSGFVDSTGTAARAGTVTRGVKGVRSVKNDLVVR
jgi:osmotically-inducible protein OsmY